MSNHKPASPSEATTGEAGSKNKTEECRQGENQSGKRFVPLSIPNFTGNERKYVDDALSQGWVSTGGAYITKFEASLESFLHVQNVAAVQSGTAALHLSLIEAGVGPGDVVLVPPLTFIAAVNPVKYRYAQPVFIDCDDSFTLDPDKLRSFLETECEPYQDGQRNAYDTDISARDGRNIGQAKATPDKSINELKYPAPLLSYHGHPVRALVVVHVFGNMADMERIMALAEQYHIAVIEDATEALGTRYTAGKYAGRYAGTIGDFGCYSFNGNKIITTGGGGAVMANNPARVDHIRYLSTQAKDDPHYYIHHEIGYNYRMTNLQAALGVAQMEELPEFIRTKQENYKLYRELFADFALGKILPFREGTDSNRWFYSLEIDRDRIHASMRDIITALQERGVQTRAIWGLIPEQLPYRGEDTYQLEKAPHYADRILNIPSSTQLQEEDIRYAAGEIRQVLEDFAAKA